MDADVPPEGFERHMEEVTEVEGESGAVLLDQAEELSDSPASSPPSASVSSFAQAS